MNAAADGVPVVEPVDTHARIMLRGWLGDAARLGIDPNSPETIQEAYETYLDAVLATEPDQRVDPTPTLTAIGMALGEHLRRHCDADWAIVSDEQGRDLALVSPEHDSILFPVDPVAGHWQVQQREWVLAFVDAAVDSFGGAR